MVNFLKGFSLFYIWYKFSSLTLQKFTTISKFYKKSEIFKNLQMICAVNSEKIKIENFIEV